MQCLELDRVDGQVTVKIKVAATGVPRSLGFVETIAPTTKVCIRDTLKTVAYPKSRQ